MIQNIMNALSAIRLPAMPEEYVIHEEITRALTEQGIEFIHEAKLGPGCRIDFLCGAIGIEVKKGKPRPAQLTRQLTRYLSFPQLEQIIIVTQKPCGVSARICGKAVHTFTLDRLWGVALP